MSAALRSAWLLVAVLCGVAVARLAGITDIDESSSYSVFVTALLGFGLYASTRGIEIAEFRSSLRTVVLAVTLGVLAKALLIFGVMYLVFRDTDYLVLGIAVAQIDPLSVAAVRAKSRMSESAKALLSAWASFDDPITVLLTSYFTVFALRAGDGQAGSPEEGAGAGLAAFGMNLLWNLLLAGAVYLAWRLVRRAGGRFGTPSRAARMARRTIAVVAVLAVGAVAVSFSLLLALALIGLFFRPDVGRCVEGMTQIAMVVATFAVGLVVVDGIKPVEGLVLGAAAYGAQIVVALALTIPRVWRSDRARLALGQQNGLTAIILALLLEPSFPGAIAIVAPAVIVVNLLHACCNAIWDRVFPAPLESAAADHGGSQHGLADTEAEAAVQRGRDPAPASQPVPVAGHRTAGIPGGHPEERLEPEQRDELGDVVIGPAYRVQPGLGRARKRPA